MEQTELPEEAFTVEIPCILIEQPIGSFFIGSIDAKSLREITYSDVRRLEQAREIETYLGIQRPLVKKRVEEIKQYVTTVDACFPTAVILAVDGRCAEYDPEKRTLTLSNWIENGETIVHAREIAKVLDGQHRIEGLAGFTGERFDVNVSIFVEMDIENQAYVFSTVNLAQTKVNKSLVYDLFEYSRSRSPQKTAHNIAVALDKATRSPFHKRIKRLGNATEGRKSETLTQSTFVEALLPYMTRDKIQDRDLYLRRKTPRKATAQESEVLIFRNMFIEERDIEIADVVLNYFESVRQKWPKAWEGTDQGQILHRTNGFKALMRLLGPAYLQLTVPGNVPSVAEFATFFAASSLTDADFNTERFKPGTSGETALYHTLRDQLLSVTAAANLPS